MKTLHYHTMIAVAAVTIGGSTSFTSAATLRLHPGYNFVGIDVVTGSNTLPELLPDAPVGTVVFGYDKATRYRASQRVKEGWSDPQLTLPPGSGAIIVADSRNSTEVELRGEPAANQALFPISQGLNLISAQRLATLQASGHSPADGERVVRVNVNPVDGKILNDFWSTYDGLDQRWYPPLPTFGPGEAFFLRKKAAAVWTREFTVNN